MKVKTPDNQVPDRVENDIRTHADCLLKLLEAVLTNAIQRTSHAHAVPDLRCMITHANTVLMSVIAIQDKSVSFVDAELFVFQKFPKPLAR